MKKNYPETSAIIKSFRLIIPVTLLFMHVNLSSQIFNVNNFDANGSGEAHAMQDCPPFGGIDTKDHLIVPMVAGGSTWWGQAYDYISARAYTAKVSTPCGTVRAHNSSHCYLGGDGSSALDIDFQNWASVYSLIEAPYNATAENEYWFNIELEIAPGGGFNIGDQVDMNFEYLIYGGGWTDHEDINEDPIATINSFNFNGNDLLGTSFNFANPPGMSGWNVVSNAGTMQVTVGDVITLAFSSSHEAEINPPGKIHLGRMKDKAGCNLRGFMTLSFDPIVVSPPFQDDYQSRIEFSLDIGSDAELSDPNQNGNEVFDPGDAYLMNGPFMSTAQNGVKDDAMIFGYDPNPVPGDPTTIVPCGSGVFDPLPYFNLNGMDNMQTSLSSLLYGPGIPSISYFDDSLVFMARYLLISYDDDGPENWSYNSFGFQSVPVNSESPMAFDTYGKTSKADEVIAIDMDPYQIPSFPFTIDSLWSEADIHPNLAPNPDLGEEQDNDVNALNYFLTQNIDGIFYFTANSEATHVNPVTLAPLNPGSIYELTGPGNFAEVVNPVTHLGLTDGVDINAFSFGWVHDSIQARLGFALLFSVDMDDWTTTQDESGGLDPSMIYYSFLDGSHHEYSMMSFRDNIDAITVVPYSFNAYALLPQNCDPPTSLNATSTSTDVVITWDEPVPPPANGYEIEFYDAYNVLIHSDVVPAGTTAYSYAGLVPGSTYTAIVRSNCSAGLSAEAAIDFTTEPPGTGDYGDAPEGDLAYLSPATIGQFPTCVSAGPPGSYIFHHPNPGLYFGPSVDWESDGNAGTCPTFNPDNYNQDECFQDGDAGLIVPVPYTIVGPVGSETIVPCVAESSEPWKTCRMAIWGISIDIHVENMLSDHAYFNLLVDWDQDGEWGGSVTCPDGSVAGEHAVVNFIVPAGFSGPLSQLSPPDFRIGPNDGYVWARFTITEAPVPASWFGSGIFNYGETEDYLIAVADPMLQDGVFINNATFGPGSDDCFEAADLIEISDSEFESGSSFIATAGQVVRVKPESHFKSGSYALLTIDQNGNFCSNYKSLVAVEDESETALEFLTPDSPVDEGSIFSVFPNPTPGWFTLELREADEFKTIKIEIYTMHGEQVTSSELPALKQYRFDLSDRPAGIYLIRVIKENETAVKRLIKQ